MSLARNFLEGSYESLKDMIFLATEKDPEIAHEIFTGWIKLLHKIGIEKDLWNCPEDLMHPEFGISNAAGFNKNGALPPTFLKYLGFDRAVVGTVTAEPYQGNPRPRIKRYPETNSMVNWMGLPGIGAEGVAKNLEDYGPHGIPTTINLMATPGKSGERLLRDLESTVKMTKNLHSVDRYELNISCPNTHGSSGAVDARSEYANQLKEMVSVMSCTSRPRQEIWLKVSPDLDAEGVKSIIGASTDYGKVKGFVISNTTTYHDPEFITSPPNKEGRGGASGNAVYERAKTIQNLFYSEIKNNNLPCEMIACGGINSPARALERTGNYDGKTIGIQMFTPLIFKGPRLLRELRSMNP